MWAPIYHFIKDLGLRLYISTEIHKVLPQNRWCQMEILNMWGCKKAYSSKVGCHGTYAYEVPVHENSNQFCQSVDCYLGRYFTLVVAANLCGNNTVKKYFDLKIELPINICKKFGTCVPIFCLNSLGAYPKIQITYYINFGNSEMKI